MRCSTKRHGASGSSKHGDDLAGYEHDQHVVFGLNHDMLAETGISGTSPAAKRHSSGSFPLLNPADPAPRQRTRSLLPVDLLRVTALPGLEQKAAVSAREADRCRMRGLGGKSDAGFAGLIRGKVSENGTLRGSNAAWTALTGKAMPRYHRQNPPDFMAGFRSHIGSSPPPP
jgi:hypothetical protein